MATKFSKAIEKFALDAEKRYRAIARTAAQAVVKNAQKTVGEGGRMRIDTGFLRASIAAAVGQMPSGPSANDRDETYSVGSYVGENPAATFLRWDPNKGEILYIGWTANYARYREAHDHFLKLAVQRWDQEVAKAAKSIR